jgi:hypothetical protein
MRRRADLEDGLNVIRREITESQKPQTPEWERRERLKDMLLDAEEAADHILYLRQEIQVRGGVDSEHPEFAKVQASIQDLRQRLLISEQVLKILVEGAPLHRLPSRSATGKPKHMGSSK